MNRMLSPAEVKEVVVDADFFQAEQLGDHPAQQFLTLVTRRTRATDAGGAGTGAGKRVVVDLAVTGQGGQIRQLHERRGHHVRRQQLGQSRPDHVPGQRRSLG
ncbi:hypothetical protein GTV15_10420, partial [Streptomyces sp. SID7803]|nr:hypothetical protein [Streptomyces sp. SID7803]